MLCCEHPQIIPPCFPFRGDFSGRYAVMFIGIYGYCFRTDDPFRCRHGSDAGVEVSERRHLVGVTACRLRCNGGCLSDVVETVRGVAGAQRRLGVNHSHDADIVSLPV